MIQLMKRYRQPLIFGVALILCSIFFYVLHYLIFRDARHIFMFLLSDVAFVFIEVLLVTLIINRLLEMHEKQSRLQKMNMVIGVFFSEVGTSLLQIFSEIDSRIDSIKPVLTNPDTWLDSNFPRARKDLRQHEFAIDISRMDLPGLRMFMGERRDFLLRLLENPNLLEHETFTNLLRAVFHLADELAHRGSFDDLPESDLKHLELDSNRAYGLLVAEWADYMKHLQANYPYLFSLAVRTNPFEPGKSVVVR